MDTRTRADRSVIRSASALLLIALPLDGLRAPAVRDEIAIERVSTSWSLSEILAAIRAVETGGSPDGGRGALGDRGEAVGPYQIHRAYWEDARVPGAHSDCRDPEYARGVVLAYWKRYCPQALATCDAEALARIHNGGPSGAAKTSTIPFWRRVERELRSD
jgi:hypothetical protein